MKTYFCNEEPIDTKAIELMGVSVKSGGAIGYFGTGLKFAIATILRSECKIKLTTDGEVINFTTEPELVRGQEVNRIYMNGQPLGFTTALGRDWELWQAYRELHSNCLDEDGVISDDQPDRKYGTVFEIQGQPFHEEYLSRNNIFLSGPPDIRLMGVEARSGSSNSIFYKNVRVGDTPRPFVNTYNLTDHTELTEDRTLKYEWMALEKIRRGIAGSDDADLIKKVVIASDVFTESSFRFNAHEMSETFLDIVQKYASHKNINKSALAEAKKRRVGIMGTPIKLDDYYTAIFERAKPLLEYLNCNLKREDFIVLNSLGPNVYACVLDDQIFVSLKTFDMGEKFVASTLYEEWLHKTEGLEDECREMQNFLFEKLFSCVGRLSA